MSPPILSQRAARALGSLRPLQRLAGTPPRQHRHYGAAAGIQTTEAPPVASRPEQAMPRPQLNIWQQAYRPQYYSAIAEIMKLRETYEKDRFIFVKGPKMARLLRGLGASGGDLEALPSVGDRLYRDPTLPFRKTRNGRFCFDFDTQTLRRLEFQPFVLSAEEGFKRHDSGQTRSFDEVEDVLQLNTAFQALCLFKAMIFHGIPIRQRPNFDYSVNHWICTLFSLRTLTTPQLRGEPALEGVHMDGVDHTMTTLLATDNMRSDSAVTFMHDVKEVTGIQLDEANAGLIQGRAQHVDFLDTLLVADYERKHSVSTVYAEDPSRDAHRDMLVFFTRKPVTKDHISSSVDSVVPHKGMPMEIPLFVPGRQQ
ncbi:2OG-Fe dioxygenase family protein [Aspergillus lucknowensis]|uniref:2OG-Fe dioxygenase-domain-containing protein n=1 Tax=Aspergillus lucknowensis TaxID=176173 RepID=A0ABR4LKT3_9EURO